MQSQPECEAVDVVAEHSRLYLLAAVARLTAAAAPAFDGLDALLTEFPFLADYRDEEPTAPPDDPAWWPSTLANFEGRTPTHLPLRALGEATALDHDALTLLMAIGLPEEDPRFGPLFDAAQGTTGALRPSLSLLNAWWRGEVDRGEVRARLRRLRELRLISVANPDAPRTQWGLQVHPLVWDAIRGEADDAPAPWLRHRPREALTPIDRLVAPPPLRATLARLPALVAEGEVRALVVRGPRHCGRRTALGAVARAMGLGLLEAQGLTRDDERWGVLRALATLRHALPVVTFDPGPGESVEVPATDGFPGPVGVVLGRHGGARGAGVEGAFTFTVETPPPDERRTHWREGFGDFPCDDLDALAARYRVTSGNIRRTAAAARSLARVDGRASVTADDAHRAARTLHREALDALATRVDGTETWASLALPPDTTRDLRDLEARCRHREVLRTRGGSLGGRLNPGVRAIFQGPSGTGKTLAARVLANALAMDLYRVDLAAVINKYIGETEKNLHQVFSLAEELDVILLLDEGDALLAQRTGVQSSNDRYANLETNYLLQRVESFEGIVLVTTNAAEHIDAAFQRRMDVSVDFRAPDAAERYAILQLHLSAEHAVDDAFLREVAVRCALSGGQIRNAALHALLAATEAGGLVSSRHLEAAVQREYRRSGGVCPLRGLSVVARGGR